MMTMMIMMVKMTKRRRRMVKRKRWINRNGISGHIIVEILFNHGIKIQ